MKSLYLVFAGLLVALSLSAQQNFVPGTLLFRNGDSAQGLIDYRKWDMSPLRITFRDGNGTEKDYQPGELKGFRISENGETYLSIAAILDVTQETVTHMTGTEARDTISGDHFFRVLVNGRVKLLLFTDRSNREHFAVTEKDSVTQLVRKVAYVHDAESPDFGKLATSNFYRQQLLNFTAGCVPRQKLQNLRYSETDIRKVLQQYVRCRYPGEKIAARKKDPQTRLSLGVLGGGSLNSARFTGDHSLAGGKLGSRFSPVIGVFVDIPVSRNRQKFSWNNEVVYTSRPVSASFTRGSFNNELDINLQYVQIQTMVKYTYPKGKLRPYVDAGVAGAIAIGGRDEVKRSGIYGSYGPAVGKALDGGREFMMPLLAGLGVRYEKLHAEVRYVFPHNISPFLAMESRITSVQLLLRYALF